ncbi:hypothetical protein ANN_12227 [Periplaneta americana]|uniref:DUF659 domain-containing protein n=1 Tax=Periplaneta americana TaxID=6978 RepID=A0ABQ8TIG9_PERAM|nr:hypothetical protein ANN_12227 [Periplaneta americana]
MERSLIGEENKTRICFYNAHFSCAAQQLNASQSTHRFSFVNHTIKTVNMPKCAVSSTQKFLVQQHITTSKHQANKQLNSKQRQLFLTQPTTSNVRSEFNIDLCRSLISADIPLYKLNRGRDFSCAAQQLNASQSTHRFSFVNHTIKTVNMPKVRHSVNLKSKLTSYISEFKEDGLSTDNKILFCNLCQCAVSSTQKFLVQQHITTSKHQANKQLNSKQRQLFLTQPTTSNVRSEFNIDLCRSLISADIPLYKLKNKVFREFLEKYTQHTIPDESTLRKTYAPSIYDETIQKIRDEIKDSSIWVSIDETPDKEGRLVGNVVIGLLSEQYSERILLHCDVLEKCNNKTIVKLFNEAMGILWPKGIMYDNVLFFISDAAPYMVKAGQALSVVYPKLTHFTLHAFHRVAEVVRDNFLK